MAENHGQVTISGGEPFLQPAGLAYLLRSLRQNMVEHIIVYTGYQLETLIYQASPASLWVPEIMSMIDILVEGPYIKALDDETKPTPYRGSSNQRVIDIRASLESEKLVLLDWDNPEIIIRTDGNMVLPLALANEFAEMGDVHNARMCGQSR
jgi:anaerobic ribonucleoside-triphosphate reductase activating protein